MLQYNVSVKSPFFDDKGFMTKAVKSDIVHVVENYLKEDDQKTSTSRLLSNLLHS